MHCLPDGDREWPTVVTSPRVNGGATAIRSSVTATLLRSSSRLASSGCESGTKAMMALIRMIRTGDIPARHWTRRSCRPSGAALIRRLIRAVLANPCTSHAARAAGTAGIAGSWCPPKRFGGGVAGDLRATATALSMSLSRNGPSRVTPSGRRRRTSHWPALTKSIGANDFSAI